MRPVSPNKPLCVVAGFLAAIGLAVSLPMLLEARNIIQISDFGRQTHGSDSSDASQSSREKSEDWEFESRERIDSAHAADAPPAHREQVL